MWVHRNTALATVLLQSVSVNIERYTANQAETTNWSSRRSEILDTITTEMLPFSYTFVKYQTRKTDHGEGILSPPITKMDRALTTLNFYLGVEGWIVIVKTPVWVIIILADQMNSLHHLCNQSWCQRWMSWTEKLICSCHQQEDGRPPACFATYLPTILQYQTRPQDSEKRDIKDGGRSERFLEKHISYLRAEWVVEGLHRIC